MKPTPRSKPAKRLVISRRQPVLIRFKRILVPADSPDVRHVLLATDFSSNSTKAFPWALASADGFGARLTLMHVVERFPIDAVLV